MAFGFDDQSMYPEMGLSMQEPAQADPYGGGFAAPQYQDMGALSGGGMSGFDPFGGMGGGDSLIDNTATAMGQPPQQPTPQIGGTQSWFKQLLSGALMGLAGGAGAEDIGSAFAGGYGAVMQKREKDRQILIEQEKMKQQQELHASALATQNLQRLQIDQEMQFASQGLKDKAAIGMSTFFNQRMQEGDTPVNQEGYASVEAMNEALEPLGFGAHNIDPYLGPDGLWYAFEDDPSKMQTQPFPGIGGQLMDPNALSFPITKTEAKGLFLKGLESDMSTDQDLLNHKQAMELAAQQGQYQVQAAAAGRTQPYGSQNDPALDDARSSWNIQLQQLGYTINDLDQQIAPLQDQYNDANKTPEAQARLQSLTSQRDQLMTQRSQLMSAPPQSQLTQPGGQPNPLEVFQKMAPGTVIPKPDGSKWVFLGIQNGKVIAVPEDQAQQFISNIPGLSLR